MPNVFDIDPDLQLLQAWAAEIRKLMPRRVRVRRAPWWAAVVCLMGV